MKKENSTKQLGWAYFWLTVIVVLFGAYLRLTGEINLSWWWITAPAWGSFIGALIVIFIALVILSKVRHHDKED